MIYRFLSTIIFIITIFPTWLVVGLFKPDLLVGLKEKLGFYKKEVYKFENINALQNLQTSKPTNILFYGVSVGEVLAMENLIKKTRETFPEINITLLTGTKTGQEIAHKKFSEICNLITYFPLDFSFCIKNMLKKLEPDAIFIMETEIWPNFANITNKKKIPTYIINARISDRTYKSYKKLSFIFAPILKKYTAIYPQSKQDMEKFISIGADPKTTEIMGNLKFDIKKPDVSSLNYNDNVQGKIMLAGSTHSGEEKIILNIFKELKEEVSDLKLIIAPRHPERNNEVFELIKKTGLDCAKRSENTSRDSLFTSHSNCLLLDTMGELGKFYSVCNVAFIGGSFPIKSGDNSGKGIGGHNPLEAVIFNKPVVSGPSIHNFKDIYAILTSTDCTKIVQSPEELKSTLKKLFSDETFYQKASKDCEKVFEQNKGALDFVLKVLQSIV